MPFSGRDLSEVKIPGADLSRALLDHTDFQRANLRGVELRQAFLRETNFKGADLTNVEFGELPSLELNENDSIAYSPDGRWLAVGIAEKIELWTADGSTKVTTFTGHNSIATSLAFDSTGERLASGGLDKTVQVWDVKTGKILITLVGNTKSVRHFLMDFIGEPNLAFDCQPTSISHQ